MKKPGTSPNWGGAREGSGPKPLDIDRYDKEKLMKYLQEEAEGEGEEEERILARAITKRKFGNKLITYRDWCVAVDLKNKILGIGKYSSGSDERESGIVELPPLQKGAVNVQKEEEATA